MFRRACGVGDHGGGCNAYAQKYEREYDQRHGHGNGREYVRESVKCRKGRQRRIGQRWRH